MRDTATEALLRRDRGIVTGGLAAITILSWIYLLAGAGTGMSLWDMSSLGLSPGVASGDHIPMSMGHIATPVRWTAAYWIIMVMMWWIMMIAMMIPSAAPTILLYARVHRHEQRKQRLAPGVVPSPLFAAGYLAAWLGFSILATVSQYLLEQIGLMSGMMMWSLDPWLSSAVLLAAGAYQLTPLKQACLKHCRQPAGFLAGHWRSGRRGAFVMGCDAGIFCVMCCWALMALLFVGGIMNVLWIAGLAIFVLIEKLVPQGERLAHVAGGACLAAAGWIVANAVAFV